MADDIIFNAPKPSLSQGELTLDQRAINDAQSTLDTQQKALNDQLLLQKEMQFNATSYSGADIKVLVHRYGSPSQDLNADITRAIDAYSQVKDLLLNLATNVVPTLSASTIGFKTGDISGDDLSATINNYTQSIQAVMSIENQIQDTGLIQFIGQGLSGKLAIAQSNPSGFIQQINQTIDFLDSLLQGWGQQSDAIQERSKDFVTTKILAELQTISISAYREKAPVRALGNVGVKGYTRGPRTIAGSMIFTVFDRNVLFELLDVSSFDADDQFRAAIKDQLPPMDITIQFANEYGSLSRMSIYGVEFVSEGQTMSIEDIILEDVCQFVARDVDPMTPVLNNQGEPYNQVLLNYNQALAQGRLPSSNPITDLRASDLKGTAWDQDKNNTAISRFTKRQNPFF